MTDRLYLSCYSCDASYLNPQDSVPEKKVFINSALNSHFYVLQMPFETRYLGFPFKMKPGQKYVQNLVVSLGDLKTPKFNFDFYLITAVSKVLRLVLLQVPKPELKFLDKIEMTFSQILKNQSPICLDYRASNTQFPSFQH